MSSLKKYIRYLFVRFYQFMLNQNQYYNREKEIESGILTIGKHTYGPLIIDSYKGSGEKVIIGSYTSISKNVTFVTGGIHPVDWISLYHFRIKWRLEGAYSDGLPCSRGDIIVGSDVWIGTDALILSGVNIGHGAVVAARSVVTRDVPAYSLVGGVPAKVIRFRFNREQIEALLKIKWWEWDELKIKGAVPLLSGLGIDEFISKYSNHTIYEE